MGAVIDGKPERPTLELLDDMVDQTLRSMVLGIVAVGVRPAEMSDEERATALEPYARSIVHHKAILCDLVRQGASLGEVVVLEEFDRLGVERDLLEVVVERRRP